MADDDSRRHERVRLVVGLMQAYDWLDSEAKAVVDRNLAELKSADRELLRLRFGHDGHGALRTLEEVSNLRRITWEQARRREAVAISKLIDPAMIWPQGLVLSWQTTAEVLLLRIEYVLADSAALERQLAEAQYDLRLAKAHVRHLEDLNAMLRRELYETGKPDRRRVGGIATLVLGLMGGFLGGVGQAGTEGLLCALRNADEAAVVVVRECGPANGVAPGP